VEVFFFLLETATKILNSIPLAKMSIFSLEFVERKSANHVTKT